MTSTNHIVAMLLRTLLIVSAAQTLGDSSPSSLSLSASSLPQSEAVNLHNWAYAYEFRVSQVVRPSKISDIQSVIRDFVQYPSPVRALGNIHSVTACVVSNGTIVDMRGMNQILALKEDSSGRQIAVVQGGVTLIQVHTWLADHEIELSFAAEIGDATVGSLTSSISKDSGVGDPALTGSLYKSIVGVTYVDHRGDIVKLSDAQNATALAHFKSSEGLLGVVVIVELLVRPAKLLTFTNMVMPTAEILEAFANMTFQVSPTSNYWILLHPDNSLVQTRVLAPPGAVETDEVTLGVIVNATRASFAKGLIAVPLTEKSTRKPPMQWTTYKHKMVNHYGPLPTPLGNATLGPRLDFTWFEYPQARFQEIVEAYMEFWSAFKKSNNGFEPAAAATYFVRRILEKPHGWFSQTGEGFEKPGFSFTLDPIFHDPNDSQWEMFLRESVGFARKHGGRMAVTQTRFVTREDYVSAPGNVALDEAPNARFTSAYFAQFSKAKTADSKPHTTKCIPKNVSLPRAAVTTAATVNANKADY